MLMNSTTHYPPPRLHVLICGPSTHCLVLGDRRKRPIKPLDQRPAYELTPSQQQELSGGAQYFLGQQPGSVSLPATHGSTLLRQTARALRADCGVLIFGCPTTSSMHLVLKKCWLISQVVECPPMLLPCHYFEGNLVAQSQTESLLFLSPSAQNMTLFSPCLPCRKEDLARHSPAPSLSSQHTQRVWREAFPAPALVREPLWSHCLTIWNILSSPGLPRADQEGEGSNFQPSRPHPEAIPP